MSQEFIHISVPFNVVRATNNETVLAIPCKPVSDDAIRCYDRFMDVIGLTKSQRKTTFAIIQRLSLKNMLMNSFTVCRPDDDDGFSDQEVIDEFSEFDKTDPDDEWSDDEYYFDR